jgi:hypothetical protein
MRLVIATPSLQGAVAIVAEQGLQPRAFHVTIAKSAAILPLPVGGVVRILCLLSRLYLHASYGAAAFLPGD